MTFSGSRIQCSAAFENTASNSLGKGKARSVSEPEIQDSGSSGGPARSCQVSGRVPTTRAPASAILAVS